MLHIKYKVGKSTVDAVWDSSDMKWSSSDAEFEKLLNEMTREEEWFDKYTPFREGSYERVVLDKLWPILDFELVSLKPTPAPDEIPGTLH